MTEVWAERSITPYVRATGEVADPCFKDMFQYNIYHQLLATKKTKFAPHKQIDVGHL